MRKTNVRHHLRRTRKGLRPVRQHTRNYASYRKKIFPIEKMVPHMYSDELGFATRHQGKYTFDMNKLGFQDDEDLKDAVFTIPGMHVESNVPKELEPYADKSGDTSIPKYNVPPHAKNLTSEQKYLRRRAKEFFREATGQVEETPLEKYGDAHTQSWHGRLNKEVAVDKALEGFFQDIKLPDPTSTKKRYVRIISNDDRSKILGPYKTNEEALKAKDKFLESVTKEREARRELLNDITKRPFIEFKDREDLGDFPIDIKILDQDTIEDYVDTPIPTKKTKLQDLFPLGNDY